MRHSPEGPLRQILILGNSTPIASSSRIPYSSSTRGRLTPARTPDPSTFKSSTRPLHTSRPRLAKVKGHYDALSLPRNATKQQVKARFYEVGTVSLDYKQVSSLAGITEGD